MKGDLASIFGTFHSSVLTNFVTNKEVF